MSRFPNTMSAAERKEAHRAKMAGKKLNRQQGLCDVGFTPSRNNGWRSFVRSNRP